MDPSFDTHYLQLSQLLDFVSKDVVQIDEVAALGNFNEKSLPLHCPRYTPKTLVSNNTQKIIEFVHQHKQVLLKPLNDCSGRGIVKLAATDKLTLRLKEYFEQT